MMTASLSFDAKTIPADLKRLPHWVNWRAEPNGERSEKIPVCVATGRNASTTDPQSWTDYTRAAKAASTQDGLGLGFVFAQHAGIVGVDLDKCRDADTGILEAWADEIVRTLNSYTEVSPSGTGVHVFVRGSLPTGKRKKAKIEAYEHGRFFTVTGQHLPETPTTIEACTAELAAFHARYLADPTPERPADTLTRTASLGDAEIVEKCRSARNAGKFDTLWRGEIAGYPSPSEADSALIGLLSFYTQDAGQLDRLFQRSGLMREKWNREDYRDRTIAHVLAQGRETYTAPPRPRMNAEPVTTQTGTGTDAPAFTSTTETQEQALDTLTQSEQENPTMCATETASLSTPSKRTAHLHTPPALAHEPNILARFDQAVRLCGVVGEERCAKLLFLALVSRLLMEPVSVVVKGLSSSGKSFTTETTLKFFPKTAYLSMTAMSERALVYMKEAFSHKTIVLYEAVALREQREKNDSNLTAYFVRSLLSEGRISYPVTVRDKNEGFVTKTIVKEGPTNMILTTTATELHGENETRLLSLHTNDTKEQTKAIMLRMAAGQAPESNVQDWHALQDWLAQAEHRVTIPYAAYLAESIPPVAVRLRRDFKALLRLIESHAMLHQYTREKDSAGRIVACAEDYRAVRDLVADLVASGVGATVPETMRATVQAVQEIDQGEGATVKTVAARLQLDRSATQRRVQSARERGYLVNVEEKRGRPGRYAMGDALPDDLEILPQTVPGPWCAHSPPDVQHPKHNVSASETEIFEKGVQLCSENGEIESGEPHPVTPPLVCPDSGEYIDPETL